MNVVRHMAAHDVTPAQAGVHPIRFWIPAFAGMTWEWCATTLSFR